MFCVLQKEKETLSSIKADTETVLKRLDASEERLIKVESELVVAKKANTLLRNQLNMIEKNRLMDNQYGRLENIEIVGIPGSVDQKDLEAKVIEVAAKIDVTLVATDISACHRLGKSETTIVRFPNRKHADSMFANAGKLKDVDMVDVLGEGHSKVFFNANLCPEFKAMWMKSKRMKAAGLISYYGSSRRGVYVTTSSEKDARRFAVLVDGDLEQFVPEGSVLADIIAREK